MTEKPFRHSFKVYQDQDWPQLRDIWTEADRGGFWDAVWLNDHMYPPWAAESRPIMDGWSSLAVSPVTNRIRFGTMVTANTFRHPALLAKQAVTLDHMSRGRLELGVGAGWHEREHEAFGIDLPPLRERFEMLDETFHILHGLMTEEVFDFTGKHRSITSARFEPKPVQKPRPPFVIGGSGPPDDPAGRPLGRPVELSGLHLRAGSIRPRPATFRGGVRGDRETAPRSRSQSSSGTRATRTRQPTSSRPTGSWGRSRAGQLHATDEHRSPPDRREAGRSMT